MKCPKCRKKCEHIFKRQEFTTSVIVEQGYEDNADTISSGYNNAFDFINNMLNKKGKGKIIGCEHCI